MYNPKLNSIGTLGYIDHYKELPNNQYEVIIFGLKKVHINEFENKFLYREADLSIIEDSIIISDEDKPRAVCDFIAGMTDNYAQNFYNKFN